MAEKERKRVDDLPAGAVKQVRELLNRPRSSADFSPAARYAVSKLCDYAEQEHELRSKAEERENGQAGSGCLPHGGDSGAHDRRPAAATVVYAAGAVGRGGVRHGRGRIF